MTAFQWPDSDEDVTPDSGGPPPARPPGFITGGRGGRRVSRQSDRVTGVRNKCVWLMQTINKHVHIFMSDIRPCYVSVFPCAFVYVYGFVRAFVRVRVRVCVYNLYNVNLCVYNMVYVCVGARPCTHESTHVWTYTYRALKHVLMSGTVLSTQQYVQGMVFNEHPIWHPKNVNKALVNPPPSSPRLLASSQGSRIHTSARPQASSSYPSK